MPRFRKQIGALPWRRKKDRIEVLLVTSRETQRWVIPKGWTMPDKANFNAAKQEAFEEAGVTGRIGRKPIGHYTYDKRMADGILLPCRVDVYPLQVTEKLEQWPEKKQRTRKWFTVSEAAFYVDEDGLKDIIRALK